MNDVVSEPSKVRKVKYEHEKSLSECLEKIKLWEKHKVDYQLMQELLKNFPDKLAYEIMVPFGSQAFVPGTIVNTNNITVLLGDNWFAEVSAKQASEIAKRRTEQCEKLLKDLYKEKKQFENWLGFISDVSEESLVEIKEEYDPEKEKLWREQHSERMREHRRKMAEDKNSMAQENTEVKSEEESKSDDYYFSRLDELQVEDEISDSEDDSSLEDEVEEEEGENKNEENQKEDESVRHKDAKRGDTSDVECQKRVDVEHDTCNSKVKKEEHRKITNTPEAPTGAEKTKTSDSVSASEEISRENGISADSAVCNGDHDKHANHDKHVRWIDLSEANSKKITFTHSKPIPQKKKNRRRRNSSNSEPEEDQADEKASPPLINSPSDIYRCFSYSMQQSKPKSILKTMHSYSSTESVVSSGEYSDSLANGDTETVQKAKSNHTEQTSDAASQAPVVEMAFTGKIQEHTGNKPTISKPAHNDSRPKSLFKSRQRR